MADSRVIAVIGATGAQGGGLVRAIQADPAGGFTARAVTRDPGSNTARELAALGAEVVAADLDDPDSVRRAFEGADGAFCVTFFWEHFSPERELAHARTMAEAARAAGVGHVVWSTLEDTRRRVPIEDDRMPTLMERYNVPHFDAKGEADAFFRDLAVPTTNLLTSYYWDNLITFGLGPQTATDGSLTFALPMGEAKLPGIASDDIGRCALGIFQRGREMVGRTVGVASEHLTGHEMAAALGRALDRQVRYQAVPPEVYRGLDFPGAADLGNMFQYKQEFEAEFRGARDPREARALNPELQSFEQWLGRNAGRIPFG